MKYRILASILVLAYVNALPYACRLYRGLDWAAQYLPDREHFLIGMIFFQAFASLPAIPIIATIWLGRMGRIALVLSLLTATSFLVFWHHDYDVASDAQAAIGLIVIPILACGPTVLAAAVGVGISFGLTRIREVANQRMQRTDSR